MSGIISPTESCLTLRNQSPYNHKILLTYLQSRLQQDQEIIIFYNEQEFSIKLSGVYNLILSFSKYSFDVCELTINHLIIYIFYNQYQLFGVDEVLMNQFLLLHCGKRFEFQPPSKYFDKLQNPGLLLILDGNFNKFHLVISHTNLSIFKYFNIESYLSMMHKKDEGFVNKFRTYMKRDQEEDLKIKRTNLSERRRRFRSLFLIST